MPNWCEHDLSVSGYDLAALDMFESAVRATGAGNIRDCSVLSAFLPVPDALVGTSSPPRAPFTESQIDSCVDVDEATEMRAANDAFTQRSADLTAAYGSDNWYDWSIRVWGTKWSDRTFSFERRPRSVRVVGECPWSPPVPGLVRISALFPTLRFTMRYYEAGMGFAGKVVCAGGLLVDDQSRTYRGPRGG
jgi:hypothetical protein